MENYYYYYDKNGNKRYLSEEEKRKLIEQRKLEEKDIKELENMTKGLIVLLISSKTLWHDERDYEREKEKLKIELLILKAVEKIKNQLLLKKDTQLVLTGEELRFAKQIEQRLGAEGIHLTHSLSNLERNKNIEKTDYWREKLQREKSNTRDFALERELK